VYKRQPVCSNIITSKKNFLLLKQSIHYFFYNAKLIPKKLFKKVPVLP